MKQPEGENKIERAVSALLACPRVEDAARQCGVSRTTLWRMSQEPEFQRLLREARARLSEQILISLQANAVDAVNTLRIVMLDTDAPTSVRVAAAGKLVDLSLRAKEQLEMEQRVSALELALRSRNARKNEAERK